jgi:hypothetical protein
VIQSNSNQRLSKNFPSLRRSLSQNTEMHTALVPDAIEKLQPMNHIVAYNEKAFGLQTRKVILSPNQGQCMQRVYAVVRDGIFNLVDDRSIVLAVITRGKRP